MTSLEDKQNAFERILNIMNELREKCPWDKNQTIESLRHLTIEETYELSDAILNNNSNEIKKELGDLLLHIIFYSKIGEENKWFDISTVIHSLCEKLIERHPHIYGNEIALDADTVKQNWEKIKLKEGNKSVLSGVPASMPSILKAYRIQDKAAQFGFDWTNKEDVLKKVEEEWEEFKAESTIEKMEDEFGDLLFSMINYARFIGLNPDDALEKTNKKFIKRFQYIESKAKEVGRSISDLNLEEMEKYWNIAKTGI